MEIQFCQKVAVWAGIQMFEFYTAVTITPLLYIEYVSVPMAAVDDDPSNITR